MPERIPVVIPPEILPALRTPRIDPERVYGLTLPDGRTVLATGKEWGAVGEDLVRLAGALGWAGEPSIRRFLQQLRGQRRDVRCPRRPSSR